MGSRVVMKLINCTNIHQGMSRAERLLSYSLLSLITSKPLSSAPMTGVTEDEEDTSKDKVKGLLNNENAWCWQEDCKGKTMRCRHLFNAEHSYRLSQINKGVTEDVRDAPERCRSIR